MLYIGGISMEKMIKCLIILFLLLNISPSFATDTLITITEENTNIQVSPTNPQVIYRLQKGTQLNYTEKSGSWFKVNYQINQSESITGYIHNSSTDQKLDKRLELLVELAYRQIGKPYVHKSGPDAFDCSGLTRWLYKHLKDNDGNVICLSSIPNSQYKAITYKISRQDTLNAIDNNTLDTILQPGDIFCLKGSSGTMQTPGHIALYVGNGQMIHAKGEQYGVILETVTKSYMTKNLVAVARVIDSDGNVHVKAYSDFQENPTPFPDDMEQLYY